MGKFNREPSISSQIQAREAGTFISPEETFSQVLQLVRRVQIGMQNIVNQNGLSGSQMWALWHISAHDGIRVSDLASALLVRHSTASNLLDKLEERKLIYRRRQTDDSRVVRVHLTEFGTTVIRDAPGPIQGHLRNALHSLPGLELIGLHRALSNLNVALDSQLTEQENGMKEWQTPG